MQPKKPESALRRLGRAVRDLVFLPEEEVKRRESAAYGRGMEDGQQVGYMAGFLAGSESGYKEGLADASRAFGHRPVEVRSA